MVVSETHEEATQEAPPQPAPQLPQLFGSSVRLTSQPLAALRSQSPKPALQVKLQVPPEQVAVALAGAEQTLPQLPQLETVVLVFTSQPLAAFMSQSP